MPTTICLNLIANTNKRENNINSSPIAESQKKLKNYFAVAQ